MAKRKYYWIVILIFSFIVSCVQEAIERRVFSFDELPEPIYLEGEKHDYLGIIFPSKIHYTGDFLIISERKTVKKDKIHILDPKNKKYISSKGVDGLGPSEITQVEQIETLQDPDEFWTYDLEQLLFSKFKISDPTKLAHEQIRIKESVVFMTKSTWASPGSMLGNMVDGWTKYLELSVSGDTMGYFGNWKEHLIGRKLPEGLKTSSIDANLASNLHRGVLKGNIHNRKFVLAGSTVDYFDIIDLENQSYKTIYGPFDQIPEFTITYSMGYQMPGFNLTELKTQYLDVFVGKESFFLLYSNKNFRKWIDSPEPDRIFEFNFESKPLSHFVLTDYKLSAFTFDESSRKFYGLSVDENPNVVEFDY